MIRHPPCWGRGYCSLNICVSMAARAATLATSIDDPASVVEWRSWGVWINGGGWTSNGASARSLAFLTSLAMVGWGGGDHADTPNGLDICSHEEMITFSFCLA